MGIITGCARIARRDIVFKSPLRDAAVIKHNERSNIEEKVIQSVNLQLGSLKTEQRVRLHKRTLVRTAVQCKKASGLTLSYSAFYYGEFDPGSGRTLAACLIHASRAELRVSFGKH
jgi:hypothetical protein